MFQSFPHIDRHSTVQIPSQLADVFIQKKHGVIKMRPITSFGVEGKSKIAQKNANVLILLSSHRD